MKKIILGMGEKTEEYTGLVDLFGLTTYDDRVSEAWDRTIVDVCRAIRDGKNMEYWQQSEAQYHAYLLVCNLLDRHELLEWGTSIRFAWFSCEYAAPMEYAALLEYIQEESVPCVKNTD